MRAEKRKAEAPRLRLKQQPAKKARKAAPPPSPPPAADPSEGSYYEEEEESEEEEVELSPEPPVTPRKLISLDLLVGFVAVGLDNLGDPLQSFVRTKLGKDSRRFSHTDERHCDVLHDTVMRTYPAELRDARIFYSDTRTFADPEAGARYKMHYGSHPSILRTLMSDRAKLQMMVGSFLRILADETARNRRSRIVIVTFCRGGRHRSVAYAHFLSKVCIQAGISVAFSMVSEKPRPGQCELSTCEWCSQTSRQSQRECNAILDDFMLIVEDAMDDHNLAFEQKPCRP